MSNEITTFQDLENKAQAIVASGFCGFKKKEEVITLALIAQDEGRNIGAVARDYHIIHGKPTLKADAMLARFQQAGGKVRWLSLTDEKCECEFTHESSGTFTLCWTIAQAKKAGLTSDTWAKYPRAMLRSRVISEGIRTSLPAVLSGVYTREEVEDMEYEEQQKTKQVKQTSKKAPKQVECEIVEENKKVIEVQKEPNEKDKLIAFEKCCNELNMPQLLNECLNNHGFKKLADVPDNERKDFFLEFRKKATELFTEKEQEK